MLGLVLESLSYLHYIIYHSELLRERLFHFYGCVEWGGGGRFSTQKKSGPNFSRKKYLQDRVNSIVLFAFLQIKRQNRVAGEKNSGLKTSYIFYC